MSEKLQFQGTIKGHEAQVDTRLFVVQFKQDGNQIIYAPALEVYGYGKTVSEARKSFKTCLEEFVDYTIAKGTLTSELKRLGWKIKGTKQDRKYKIPEFADLLRNNKRLIEIINAKKVRTYQEKMPLAVPV